MKLTTSNVVAGNIAVNSLTVGNATFSNGLQSINTGNVSLTPEAVTVGNVSITPAAITTPQLIVGGVAYSGGIWGGIVDYQEFTASGTWINPINTYGNLNRIFYDDFETFTGWTTVGTGTVAQSSSQKYAGSFSAVKSAGGDPNGAYKLLGKEVYRKWKIEVWFYRETSAGSADRIAIVNSAGDGYGFYNGSTVSVIERRDDYVATALTAPAATRPFATWYRSVFEAFSDNTFTLTNYNADGTLINTVTSTADATYPGPFDRIAILGGATYYVDELTVYSADKILSGNEQAFIMMWGGGGAANSASGQTNATSGGGGACVIATAPLSTFTNTCSVTVGAGSTSVANGGSSIFVINATANLIAYGGGSGNTSAAGAGGGTLSAGSLNVPGGPLGNTTVGGASTFGGSGIGSTAANAGVTIFGGGSGGIAQLATNPTRYGGNSVYGGGGGVAANTNGTPMANFGTSIFGGTGSGDVPGGGGSAFVGGSGSAGIGAGGRGEVRVWVMGAAGTTVGAPTYVFTANNTTLFEGGSVLYTVTTTNIANGTSLYYTLNNSSTATSADFTTAVNGAFTVTNGIGTFTLTANNDSDSAAETFQLDIRTGNTTGPIVASNSSFVLVAANQQLFTTNTSWVVPTGVNRVSIVAVGAGGGGSNTNNSPGGGGGALSYVNNLSVTPGETLTVVVGVGANNVAGGDSYVRRSTTDLVLAKGGARGVSGGGQGGSAAAGVGDVKYSGGNGGAAADSSDRGGGGGAAGYSGNGGKGGDGAAANAGAGAGGGGGGGLGSNGDAGVDSGHGGGGVGVLGEGASGAAGVVAGGLYAGRGGSSGSVGATATNLVGGNGGLYGGGGGAGRPLTATSSSAGGNGAVRIIWGGNRVFPNTNTGDM